MTGKIEPNDLRYQAFSQHLTLMLLVSLVAATGLLLTPGDVMPRRAVLSHAAAAAAAIVAPPLAALANTEAELSEPMSGFSDGEQKRAEFMKKQKAFKKAWRKELSNLEFSSSDAEFIEAVQNLAKLIIQNGREIPEGVRKMDLDQVYKTVKPRLQKDARMEFAKLDKMVLEIVTVKNMGPGDDIAEFNK